MTWLAEIVDDRIHVNASGYSERAVVQLRLVPGGMFRKESKRWTFPKRWDVCLALRQAATNIGVDLEIGQDLLEWAYAEQERYQKIPDVKSMDLVGLEVLPTVNPLLYKAASSRPFQTVGIKFAALNREVLIADAPGLGKTLQIIGAFQEAEITGPILVMGPKAAVQITWPQQISAWSNGDLFGVLGAHMTADQRKKALRWALAYCKEHPDERFWILTGAEYIRMRAKVDEYQNYVYHKGKVIRRPVAFAMAELVDVTWAGVVMDESHRTMAGATGNKKKWSAQRVGLGMLKVREDKYIRAALSGTPFRGKKENLWGTLNWLRPDLYRSYWKWIDKHFVSYTDNSGYGPATVATDEVKDIDAFYAEAARVMIRRTKKEVAKDLPPKQYAGTHLDPGDPNSPIRVWLPMEGRQLKAYKQMVELAEADLEGGLLLANGIFSEIIRMKQFANAEHRLVTEVRNGMDTMVPKPMAESSNKVDWIINWLDERGMWGPKPESDSKVIIASQFTSMLNSMSRLFKEHGTAHHMLTGETSDKRRIASAEEFQGPGGPLIFLLNIKAGGTSITLDAADDVIVVDETADPDDVEQVEDRAHRISRTDHQVTIWKLASLGTIDEGITATADYRETGLKEIMDGSRGIEFFKHLLDHKGE